MTRLSFCFLALFTLILFPLFLPVKAINMESTQYRIQFGNVDIGAKNLSSSSYKLSQTMGQTAANQFNSAGYIVKAGFQYIHSIIPFSFTVSSTRINLGSLISGSPSTDTSNLTVSAGGASGYSVTAIEEGPLKTLGDSNIVDTSCDGGVDTCTETLAKTWGSASAYGFGYSVSGDGAPSDFISSSYYRPFPDRTAAESPAVVMSSANVTLNSSSTPRNTKQSTITFKANVSAVQEAGSYQTVINFVATPGY